MATDPEKGQTTLTTREGENKWKTARRWARSKHPWEIKTTTKYRNNKAQRLVRQVEGEVHHQTRVDLPTKADLLTRAGLPISQEVQREVHEAVHKKVGAINEINISIKDTILF